MHKFWLAPPVDENQLYQRALLLAGKTIDDLAIKAQLHVPKKLKYNKGWIGLLLERYLGSYSTNKPQQDFPQLGIELKTVPVNKSGRPLESTFVCTAPLSNNSGLRWKNSLVWQKLQRVLWIPIVTIKKQPLAERCIGMPILWSPSALQEQQLRCDWEELIELIALGHVTSINAHHGDVLQLRPKAANSFIVTEGIGQQGQPIMVNPLGFYLRTHFTASLLAKYFIK